jgi:hypothetical protein
MCAIVSEGREAALKEIFPVPDEPSPIAGLSFVQE